MPKVIAINTVIRPVPGGKQPQEFKPGAEFDSSGSELDYLKSVGAVKLAPQPRIALDTDPDGSNPQSVESGDPNAAGSEVKPGDVVTEATIAPDAPAKAAPKAKKGSKAADDDELLG